jgi:hypothetical protein
MNYLKNAPWLWIVIKKQADLPPERLKALQIPVIVVKIKRAF